MDTYLAVASRREVRSYAARPLEEDVARRILDAGRVSGSSKNRQPWTFVVLEDETAAEAARSVFSPPNLLGAPLVVAIVTRGRGRTQFDAGRAAQNMMLAGWNEGVGSCPNGPVDREALERLLGLDEEEELAILLSFGYPARPRDPSARTAQEWLARADRRPLDEVVRRA
jgi:nitroreductase